MTDNIAPKTKSFNYQDLSKSRWGTNVDETTQYLINVNKINDGSLIYVSRTNDDNQQLTSYKGSNDFFSSSADILRGYKNIKRKDASTLNTIFVDGLGDPDKASSLENKVINKIKFEVSKYDLANNLERLNFNFILEAINDDPNGDKFKKGDTFFLSNMRKGRYLSIQEFCKLINKDNEQLIKTNSRYRIQPNTVLNHALRPYQWNKKKPCLGDGIPGWFTIIHLEMDWQNTWDSLQQSYGFMVEQQFKDTDKPNDTLKAEYENIKNVELLAMYDLMAPANNAKFELLYNDLLNNPNLLIDGSKECHEANIFLNSNHSYIHHYAYDDKDVLKYQNKCTQISYWQILAKMIWWQNKVDTFYGITKDKAITLPQYDLKTNKITMEA